MTARLQFGNTEHIRLVNRALHVVEAHRQITELPKTVTRRTWRKPGRECAKCDSVIVQGDVQVSIGSRVFYERCFVDFALEIRRDLRALGYNVEALHAD